MVASKYLDRIGHIDYLKETGAYTLRGNRILVERIIETETKTKSGLILPTEASRRQLGTVGADKPQWYVVLDVGEGYVDDNDGKILPGSMEVARGDVVMINRLSVKHFSLFGNMDDYISDTIGIARENDIEIRFQGSSSYQQFFEALNKEV